MQANKTNSKTKREDDKKAWHNGALPEHITDYYAFQRQKDLKINDGGRKREAHDNPKGQGIDHVWRRTGPGSGPGSHRYIVGETKGSLAGQFAFIAEASLTQIPFTEDKKLGASRVVEDEAALRGRNADGSLVRSEKGAPKRGLNETKGKGVQMSHEWIVLSLKKENIPESDKSALRRLINQAKKGSDGFSPAPWDRWICLITAKQKVVHEKSKGSKHQLQPPIVVIPDQTLIR